MGSFWGALIGADTGFGQGGKYLRYKKNENRYKKLQNRLRDILHNGSKSQGRG